MEENKEENKEEKNLNIFQKMDLVRVEVGAITKGIEIKTSDVSSYKAVSEVDVLKAVNEAEHKHGLVSFQERLEVVEQARIQTTKGIRFYIRVKAILKVVNIENPFEFVYCEGLGDGLDSGDKACGKANTYAAKYALLKLYKIASGEDPDYFKSEREELAPKATEKQVKELTKLITNTLGENKIEEFCKTHGVDDISELTQKEIEESIKKAKLWRKRNNAEK